MAGVVAGGLFNAIAFAGARYIFHKLDKSGYEKEMKRHDEAMEKLNADREKWYEKNVEHKNKIALFDKNYPMRIKIWTKQTKRYENYKLQKKI